MAGPEEAPQTVASTPRDHVDVHVGDALGHLVVDRYEASLCLQGHLECPADARGGVEEGLEQLPRQIDEGLVVLPRDYEDVAGKKWPLVEESHNL